MTMFTNVNTTAVPACCQTVQTTDRCASLWNAYSGRRSWQLKKQVDCLRFYVRPAKLTWKSFINIKAGKVVCAMNRS